MALFIGTIIMCYYTKKASFAQFIVTQQVYDAQPTCCIVKSLRSLPAMTIYLQNFRFTFHYFFLSFIYNLGQSCSTSPRDIGHQSFNTMFSSCCIHLVHKQSKSSIFKQYVGSFRRIVNISYLLGLKAGRTEDLKNYRS